jgi:hypothetical protein
MLTENIKSTFKDAATKLTGSKKRAFMARVTQDYCDTSPRQAETELGWSRQVIMTGAILNSVEAAIQMTAFT